MSDSITSSRPSIGPGKTLRTLGALEEYFWLLGQRAARTLVVAAEVEGVTSVDRWRDALRALQARHTILSARIQQTPGFRPAFVSAPDVPLALNVVPRESGTRLFELVSAELATRFAPGDALLRTTLLHGRDRTTLLLAADHAAFDGASLMFLIRDLLRALSGELPRTVQTMPLSHDQWLGLPVSERHASTPAAAPLRAPVDTNGPRAPLMDFAAADEVPLLQQVWLEPSITSLLTRRARAKEASVHGALSAALMLAGRALSRGWRASTVRCASRIDLRDQFAAGEQLGLLEMQRDSTLEPWDTPPFWDLAQAIKQDVDMQRSAADAAGSLSAPVLDMISAHSDPQRLLIGSRQRAPMLAIDNYGRLPIASRYGRLRLRWVTPATMSGAPHTQTVSIATVDGLLCMTNVSAEPMPSLLGTARRLLLAQLD
ncbi:MAG TPA: hypothetical protein VNE00_29820 [Paraburkholderia sp.]|nr:hypothetical protein [Paraburkholderia sp.]